MPTFDEFAKGHLAGQTGFGEPEPETLPTAASLMVRVEEVRAGVQIADLSADLSANGAAPVPTLAIPPFRLALGSRVTAGGKAGKVVGRAEYLGLGVEYEVRHPGPSGSVWYDDSEVALA